MHISTLKLYFILQQNSFIGLEFQWMILMKNATASRRWFGIVAMRGQYKVKSGVNNLIRERMRMRVSYQTLFRDTNTIYLVERQRTQIRGLLLFLGITPKMRDDKKTGPSPLFEYEERAISALSCSRLRHVAYPFPVARWHVTLDVKHDPGQRCSRVCTYGSRRSCKAWDNVPRRYKSSLLTALFLIRALEPRPCFSFSLRREVVSVIGNYTAKFHDISHACRFRYKST